MFSAGLIEAYDQLRTVVLERSGKRPVGYGVILQRGVFTWMRTWSPCRDLPAPKRSPVRLPAPVESELVRTIVSLLVDTRAPLYSM